MPNRQCTTIHNSRIVASYIVASRILPSRIFDLGMLILSPRSLRVAELLLIVFILLQAPMVSASDWSAPEAQLAGKIAAVIGPGAVALEFTNRSSLTREEFDVTSRGLRTQLAASGLRFGDADQAAATVKISFSEDLQNYVWIAEIHQGAGESSVVMISTPRTGVVEAGHDERAVTIHKALLWVQPERILDVAVMDGNPTHMAVLDTTQVALYRLDSGRWLLEQPLPIAHERPWPRDLRGRLILRKDHLLDAYLPGVFCRSTTSSPLALNCYQSDDPWPIGTDQSNLNAFFTPSRNYFTGALAPGVGKQSSVPPFYSAASLPRDKYTLWVFAAMDGQIHLLDGMSDQTVGRLEWGSDIASVTSACAGAGWNILATGSGDRAADSLRTFDVADREPVAVSQPTAFRGPITALWTEGNGSDAIAISDNLETGDYEAFRLSFTCGQ
jgi:hypothetical protein